MLTDVPLDYAVFQLSPRRSRCELFVSYDGTTEKLASGLVKPFVTHLKVVEEQVALAGKSIKLDVERYKNAETWFTKGTIERFVRFVSTPEVMEMVNTFDAEMSQLEAARKIYQGAVDRESGASGVVNGATGASDATKKELLRAIDVRLSAVKQDLTTACSRASAAGFNPETVLELQFFANHFGAQRLSEACSKFITLTEQRADLFESDNSTASTWKALSDNLLRSSTGSDMSLDDSFVDQHTPSTCTASTVTFPSRRLSREASPSPIDDPDERESIKDKDIDEDKDVGSTTSTTSKTDSASTSTGKPQLTRRLSVQERISLFENKAQISPSATTPTSTGAKPELRRLSSDVNSSTDKAVLRRWSGASDMSIDVSGERKEPDSNANTPTPSSASSSRPLFPPKSKDPSDPKPEAGDKDSKLPLRAKFGSQSAVSSGGGSGIEESVSSESNSKIPSFSGRSSDKDQSRAGFRSRPASFGRLEDFEFENQSIPSTTQIKSQPGNIDQLGCANQSPLEEKRKGLSGGGGKRQEEFVSSGASTKVEGTLVDTQDEANDVVLRDQHFHKSQFNVSQRGAVEGDLSSATSKFQFQPIIQTTGVEADPVPAQPRWKSSGEVQKAWGKDSESLEDQTEGHSMQMENADLFRVNSQGYGSGSDQMMGRGSRKDIDSMVGGGQMGSTAKGIIENQEALFSAPMDQVLRARQAKGNQGVNDELKLKANELEKLFAEHKLRVPSDQSNSARRVAKEVEGGPVSRKQEKETSPVKLSTMKPAREPATGSSEMEKYYSTPSLKTVDNHDDVTPKHNIYSLSFSDDSRGKLYQKYMQKRDVKLREDWSSKRPEKEAQMKAMQDSLEKSRAELKVRSVGSAEKRSSAYDSRRRDEKMRSYNVRSTMKRDQPTDLFMSDEEDGQAEFLGKKFTETFLGDSSSKIAQSKRAQPNKTTSSAATRNSTAAIPRSSGKTSNSAAGRRRMPYDNPLAQSVPNFSDLRKENTKPSPAGSKPARPQGRIHARKKSTSEDLLLVNEEKPRRSQLLRKGTATSTDLNNSRNSDDVDDTQFMPSKYQSEENDDYEKISDDMQSKSLPRKGNGIGRIAGSGLGLSKALVMEEAARNGHSFGDTSFVTEEMMDEAKDDEHDYETTIAEESTYIDDSKGRLSHESDKSGNSVYENNSALRFVSQTGSVSATDLPISMPSLFRSMGSALDSPGESPGSWNSRLQNPFAFSHEISDVDASDSPMGSPASWNFHSLSQSEAEAARMRKKWGAAQKPVVGIDSPHSQSRKDVTRGLKRFLKFGRKNRTSESLADWISATTSEGDDSEDGRDLANRSSEDLRKSRMGFSQSHNSDEGFNESDFNEQVQALRSSIPTPPSNFKLREEHLSGSSLKAPKSFFSLSNFRSKGNDSKLR